VAAVVCQWQLVAGGGHRDRGSAAVGASR